MNFKINSPFSDLKSDCENALAGLQAASRAVMDIYSIQFSQTSKSDGSPVTDADIASHKIIETFLSKSPYKTLSEEGLSRNSLSNEEGIWIVDPLDGTTEFISKTGEFTIMLALVKHGIPQLGFIVWPEKEIIYAARTGQGAFEWSFGSWKKIHVSNQNQLVNFRALVSRSHLADIDRNALELMGVKNFQKLGSSLKAARIACGEAELFFTSTGKMQEWDTAASHCIIQEAGGRMSDLRGNPLVYNKKIPSHCDGILISNGFCHEILVSKLGSLISL